MIQFFLSCILFLLFSAQHAFSAPLSSPAPSSQSKYRGWDYLMKKLRADGVSDADLNFLFKNPRMPYFGNIPFKLAPKESHALYQGFINKSGLKMCADFLGKYHSTFAAAEKKFGVPREIITAILYVESQFGRNTGKEPVFYRLARIATVGEPGNIEWNYARLKKDDPLVTKEGLKARAEYLENTFRPEIVALLTIAHRNRVNIFNIKGSFAGAFGKPQFLPSTFLRYGYDGNRDGIVSLFSDIDSIWSIANFIGSFGFRRGISHEKQREILWRYNKSDAYIDTILGVAGRL